jgi:hypothetical protein
MHIVAAHRVGQLAGVGFTDKTGAVIQQNLHHRRVRRLMPESASMGLPPPVDSPQHQTDL